MAILECANCGMVLSASKDGSLPQCLRCGSRGSDLVPLHYTGGSFVREAADKPRTLPSNWRGDERQPRDVNEN